MSDKFQYRKPSRSTKNKWFYDQNNKIRQLARTRGLTLIRSFYDAEGVPTNLVSPLPLARRHELAKLFNSLKKGDAGIVIVDDRCRLDEDDVVRSLLGKEFAAIGVKVFEAKSGEELSSESSWAPALAVSNKRRREFADRQMRAFKALVTRMCNGTVLGQKPFGRTERERLAVNRIATLFRIQPRDKWRIVCGKIVKHRSFREIARILNEEGVPTRTGAPWSDRMVHKILLRLRKIKGKTKEPYERS